MAHECLFTMDASSIKFGVGATREVGFEARRLAMKKVMVVTDPGLSESDAVKTTLESLRADDIDYFLYDRVRVEPTDGSLQEAIDCAMGDDFDGFVAVGGGSSIDTAKAANLYSTYPADFLAYVNPPVGEGRPIPGALKPLIAVPTTAGTGSEVTRVTVITDAERHVKMMLLDDHLLCDAALVDFELSLSCPRDLTAFVGVDSLTHAIESYVSSKANPVTEDWSLRAAALIGAHLRRAWAEPEDREARAAMALGATLAGMAFSNASVALVHGMSRPIGGHFGVPHGLSNAVLLPEVTRWSLPGAPERYRRIAEVLGVDDLVGALQQLNDDLEIPRLATLAERDRFDAVTAEMAEAALESGSPAFNPRVPGADEVVALYATAYDA